MSLTPFPIIFILVTFFGIASVTVAHLQMKIGLWGESNELSSNLAYGHFFGDNKTGNTNNVILDSDVFEYNTASQPVVMNNTGSFSYYQADVNNEDTDYVMNGTIDVVDLPNNPTVTTATGNDTDQTSSDIDTVGTLMVPTEDLTTYTSHLGNGGISVLSTHNFNDIRSGDPQTLIIWGASSTGTNSRKCRIPTGGDNFYAAI